MEALQQAIYRRHNQRVDRRDLEKCMKIIAKKHGFPLNSLTTALTKSFSRSIDDMGMFINVGNSCYLDSVLVALFTPPEIHPFVKRGVLGARNDKCPQLGKELNDIYDSLSRSDNIKCSNLRKVLSGCVNSNYESFWTNNQQDASEFLRYLFSMSDVSVCSDRVVTYGSNDVRGPIYQKVMTSSIRVGKLTPLYDIPFHMLTGSQETAISNLLIKRDDSGELEVPYVSLGKSFRRRLQLTYPEDYPYMVINLERYGDDDQFLSTKVVPNKTLTLGGRTLNLRAIVIWKRSHYTCMMDRDSRWYHVDDLADRPTFIGSYDIMLTFDRSLASIHGVMYFYG